MAIETANKLFNDSSLLLRDGIELLPEQEIELVKFKIDADDQIHIDNFNQSFDEAFITDEQLVEMALYHAVRWWHEIDFAGHDATLSKTQYESGAATRSTLFKRSHLVLSTIDRPDGQFGESHLFSYLGSSLVEVEVLPLTRRDINELRYLGNTLQTTA